MSDRSTMQKPDKPEALRPLTSLKKRAEFNELRKAPRFTCPQFVLQGNLHINEAPPTVGYTVTKKTGNAAERNRMKRRLRMAAAQAFQQYQKRGNKPNDNGLERVGGKVVIVARRSVLSEPYGSLVANLTKGIDRLVANSKKAG